MSFEFDPREEDEHAECRYEIHSQQQRIAELEKALADEESSHHETLHCLRNRETRIAELETELQDRKDKLHRYETEHYDEIKLRTSVEIALAAARRRGNRIKEREQRIAELEDRLREVVSLIDDILYDPHFKPVDRNQVPIRGSEYYLLSHPIQYDHLPALRQWFVENAEEFA